MRAELNFLRPMAVEPLMDISGSGRGNLQLMTREVEITDADAQDPPPSIARNGFGAVPFSASLPDGEPGAAFRQTFANLCAAAVKADTGAARVVGIPMSVQVRRGSGQAEEAPISVCHADFTPTSAARRVAELLGFLGIKARPRRFAAFNAWWLARPGPQDRPLALCDATTIAAPDVQFGRATVMTPTKQVIDYGEIALQRYSPRHRWYWYPRLTPNRLLLFCGFDSDPTRPSMVIHSAFANADCPPGTPPRVSVECRCFALW